MVEALIQELLKTDLQWAIYLMDRWTVYNTVKLRS